MSLINAWTMEELDTLRRMWLEHRTCREIGMELGRSRNSIIGKAHRLGLPKRPNNPPPKPGAPVGRVRSFPQQQRSKKRLPPMHLRIVTVPDAVPVPLHERTGCCYPTTAEGPHLFCNMPKGSGDYCEYHFYIMYPKRRAA